MDDKDTVKKWEHEIALEKIDRANHRLWVVVILLILLLAGTNGAWIYYESQWEGVVESTTATQEIDTGDGDFNGTITNQIGDIYGESETNSK